MDPRGAALLFGQYSPVPRQLSAVPLTVKAAKNLEARRIAASILPPTFADPTFSERSKPLTQELPTASAMTSVLLGPQPQTAERGGVITGFSSVRTTVDGTSELAFAVLEYPSQAAAERSAAALTRVEPDRRVDTARAVVPGFPAASGWTGLPGGGVHRRMYVFMPLGALVLFAFTQGPNQPPDDQPARIGRLLAVETAALATFRPNSMTEIMRLPADPTGLLGHTVSSHEGAGALAEDAVFAGPPLHWDTDPVSTKMALDDAGVDLISFGRTQVYRARDPAAAARLQAAFATVGAPYRPQSIAPDAVCMSNPQTGAPYYCVATRSRYLIEVGAGFEDDVVWALNAQYAMLANF